MRADLRLAVAQNAGAARLQPIAGREDVVDLVAQMMNGAARIFGDEAGDRRIFAERLEQFDLGVGQFDEDDVTPCSASDSGAETFAPSVSR